MPAASGGGDGGAAGGASGFFAEWRARRARGRASSSSETNGGGEKNGEQAGGKAEPARAATKEEEEQAGGRGPGGDAGHLSPKDRGREQAAGALRARVVELELQRAKAEDDMRERMDRSIRLEVQVREERRRRWTRLADTPSSLFPVYTPDTAGSRVP